MNGHYKRLLPFWEMATTCYEGAQSIKRRDTRQVYLPPQPAEIDELATGLKNTRYDYRSQIATYENIFKPTVDDIVGLMGKNEPIFRFGVQDDSESPPEITDMLAKGNRFSDGLIGTKGRINFAQTLYGRYGLLLDVVTDYDGLNPEFCITEYLPQLILDGDHFAETFDSRRKLRWVLLDESGESFDTAKKEWNFTPRRRILGIDSAGRYYNAVLEGDEISKRWIEFNLENPELSNPDVLVYPNYRGNYLNFIPFTVCNTDRLGLDFWQVPPYFDVAQIAIALYVVDSWYKMGLYQFSSPTLVITNAKQPEDGNVRLGGSLWLNAHNSGLTPTAQILETSGAGLSELRSAKEELKKALRYSSIRELLGDAGANSSGDALRLRTTSGTATIATSDKTSVRALEEQVEYAAIWAGASRDEASERIEFEADTSYLGEDFQLASVVSFIQANSTIGLLSRRNVYSILEKVFRETLSDYETNEDELLAEEDHSFGLATKALQTAQNFMRNNSPAEEEEEEEEEEGEQKENAEEKEKEDKK